MKPVELLLRTSKASNKDELIKILRLFKQQYNESLKKSIDKSKAH